MNKIKAHFVVSLDGYIAYRDGDTGWIPGELEKEISAMYNTSEILLAGSNTYNAIFEQNGSWPYKNTYVISRYDGSMGESEVHYIYDCQMDAIGKIKLSAKSDIMVIGGGGLITSLINNRLLDELTLYVVPFLLGEGIRLFGKVLGGSFDLVETVRLPDGIMKMRYKFSA